MSASIDIHSGKLLEWLKSRNHCSKDWSESAVNIRKKINHAILDMPEIVEIKKMLTGNCKNKIKFLEGIVEILKDTESESKNIFGMYSSQRMKDWKEIIKTYEKDGIYLADSAQILMRMVSYEIPAHKKLIEKVRKSQNDYARKEKDYSINATDSSATYKNSCKQYGIKGDHVKQELLELATDLPNFLDECATQMKSLQKALTLYSDFVAFTLQRKEVCCSSLLAVIERGNVTAYEVKYGQRPLSVEPAKDLLEELKKEVENSNSAADDEAEIDWDAAGDDEGINFDISLDDDDADKMDGSADHPDQITSEGSGVAKGEEARSILENLETREMVINDLMELAAFLQRFVEERTSIKEGGNVLVHDLFQSAPANIQALSMSEVETMHAQVQGVIDKITNKTTSHLLLIRSSPRYVDRLVETVTKHSTQVDKCRQLQRLMEQRRTEAIAEEGLLVPQLEEMRVRCRQLKEQVQGEISKKYSNRNVNIIGEISSI